jgi:hypothetical protein
MRRPERSECEKSVRLKGGQSGLGQEGSALVVVMLVLAAVAILGVMSINTSTVELSIARNEREIREAFYLSEGAAMEGIQRLMDTPRIDLEEKIQFWHHSAEAMKADAIDLRDPQDWDVDGRGEDNGLQSQLDEKAFLAAVEYRLSSGSSAVCTESRLYLNRVYGHSTKYNAVNLVEIGYYLRY